jgi:hypothetical protein
VRQKDFHEIGTRWRWLFWETLIIVLGVLIAFAVNDYWSDRLDRELEIQYLKRLHADIKTDEAWTTSYNQGPIITKMAALDAIAPVVRGREPVPDDVDTFLLNVTLGGIGGASPSYFVNRTTFDDLKATGNLRLILDTGIRTKLSTYYFNYDNNHARILARVSGYFMFVHSILPAELRDDFNMEIVEEFGIEHALEKIKSHEFQDLLNQEYNLGYFITRLYAVYASVSEEMAAELQAHIEELESR